MGAKKNGPAAIPARAAEFYMNVRSVPSPGGTEVNLRTYRIRLLQLRLMIQFLLIREIQLSRQRRNSARERSQAKHRKDNILSSQRPVLPRDQISTGTSALRGHAIRAYRTSSHTYQGVAGVGTRLGNQDEMRLMRGRRRGCQVLCLFDVFHGQFR